MKKNFLVALLAIMLAVPSFVFANGQSESAGDKEIEIRFSTIWVGADTKAAPVKELVDEFNTANAGKIKVIIEENPDADAYRSKINTMLGSGSAPDVFSFNPDQTSFMFYDSDVLMDFTDELKGDWASNFVDGAIESATINGKTKSLPFEMGYTPIWYNMDILEEAGVSEIPQTFDEFWDACEKIKAAGYVPTSQMTGGTNAWTSMLWYCHILNAIGGPNVWEKDFATDPVFVEAAEILNRMYQDGNTTVDAIGGDAGVSGGHFLAGQTAMFINGPWYIGRVESEAPEVFAATQIGPGPGDKYSNGQVGFPQSNLVAANTSDPAKKEAVLSFLKWMTTPENAAKISQASGAMLAVKTPGVTGNRVQTQFNEAVNNASFLQTHFQFNFATDVMAEFGQALAKMASGKATAEEFVAQIASKIR
ncbi:MAG: extracellular solute-binding protein [Sphaerochaetaceae bacterium]|nr:extracellular solute-binding protein [Sphaerochaetaceae bacterium]MDC7249943.1 extracellular solute-binding protein [Sphaerochaetaceae bacterium]